jgi:hypothetical protein
MNTKKKFWMAAWLFILLAACRGQPEFVNHEPPSLTVTTIDSSDERVAALGCDVIQPPPNLIGGLDPSYPIAICSIQYTPGEGSDELAAEIERGEFLHYTGGLFGEYIRYVIQRDGEFVLLKTEADFRTAFAPIESPEEALSYALAVRNLAAYYDLQYLPGYEYEVGTIEDTHVTAEADGYIVHLFHQQVAGCGPHWTSAVDVRVAFDGQLEEIANEALFHDPNTDELCVD